MRANVLRMGRRGALALCLALTANLSAWAQPGAAVTQTDPALEKLERMAAAVHGDPALLASYRQWFDRQSEALRAQARHLAAQGGARNLFMAATLNDLPERSNWFGEAATTASPQSRQWSDAAASARPRDRLVSWVEALRCAAGTRGCDRTGGVMFLLENERDNAAVYLLALDEAGHRGDGPAMRQFLTLAAQAPRYDTHAQEWLQLVDRSIRSSATVTLEPSLLQAIHQATGSGLATIADGAAATFRTHLVLTSVAAPPLDWLMSFCSARDLDEQARDDCIRVMDMLVRNGTTTREQFSGTIGLVRLSATDADSRAWREWLRQISWINDNAGRLIPVSMIDNSMSYGEFLQWLIDQGEFAAYSELVARNGVGTEPPNGWLPDNPRLRALITSGSDEGF